METEEPNKPQDSGSVEPPYPQPSPEQYQPLPSSDPVPVATQPVPGVNGSPGHHINAGTIVLQWLTYAFWGWTVLALSILTGIVVTSIINSTKTGDSAAYTLAALLVLLPISFLCDLFYSKKEPAVKSGAEVLVMVIHAVIFALFGIGAVIFAVFSIVQLLLSSNSEGWASSLITSLVIAVVYGLTFLRTLNLQKFGWLQSKYRLIMVGITGLMLVLSIIGPIASERKTRTDKLIENNLSTVVSGINDYTKSNGSLPGNLSDVEYRGEAQKLIDMNLVEYKPQPGTFTNTVTYSNASSTVYRYELCVNFVEESSYYSEYSYSGNSEYTTYVSGYNHPKGYYCYKVETK